MKTQLPLITPLHNMKLTSPTVRAVWAFWAVTALAATAPAQQLDSSAFNHQYNGDVYPVPGYTEFPPTNWITAPSTDGDILSYQNEIVESPYWFSDEWLGGPNPVNNASGWTMEVRVRIRDDAPEDPDFGAFNVFAKDVSGNNSQGRRLSIRLGKGYVTISSLGSGNTFLVDNTNSFHVYRFGQQPASSTMRLWRDGILLYSGVSRTSNDSTSLAAQMYWGDGSGATGGPTMDVDYVRWDNSGLYEPVVNPPAVVQSPPNTTNAVGAQVTLTAVFTNAVTGAQWYKDNNPLGPPATLSIVSNGQMTSYDIPSLQPLDEGSYYCEASNAAGVTNTATAYLDVLDDVTPPTVVGNAVSVWGKRVRLQFSEMTDTVSLGEPANYSFQDGALAVASVTVLDSFRVDVFTATAPVPGSNYVLLVSNVQDTSANPIAANTPVAFIVDTNFPAPGNLIMAFNEDSAVPVSEGVEWRDLSGAENHALNPGVQTYHRRPTLVHDALLGHDIFNFAPTSSEVVTLAVPFTGSLGLDQNNYTWFAVARCSNLGTGAGNTATPRSTVIIRSQPDIAVDTFWLCEYGSAFHNGEPNAANEPLSEYQKAVYTFGRDDSGGQVSAWSYPIANDRWYIVAGHADNTGTISKVLDPASNQMMSGTRSTNMLLGVTMPLHVWFGSYGDNRFRFGGDMAEVLVYTGFNPSEMDNVIEYLRLKYFPPLVTVQRTGANIEIHFGADGVLQSAAAIEGPYEDVAGNPTSPYVITPGSQLSEQYFRARR